MTNEFLFHRILNGYYYSYFHKKKLKVISPNASIKYRAQRYETHVRDKLKFHDPKDFLSEQKRAQILNFYKIWVPEDEEELKKIDKDQEQLKVALYLGYKHSGNRKMFQKKIADNNKQINELLFKKDTYKEYTKEYFVNKMKNIFLLRNTVYIGNKLYFKKYRLNNFIVEHYLNQYISERIYNEIPKLIRSDIWSNHWSASNGRIIRTPIKDWNDEQLMAINSSRGLFNIYKHPEAPDADIMSDPVATEGWIIYQNKKAEKEKKIKQVEDSIEGKGKDAGEIYVMSNSKAEEQEIYDLNDPANRRFIKQTQTYVQNELEKNPDKKVEWVDIPAVQQQKLKEQGLK